MPIRTSPPAKREPTPTRRPPGGNGCVSDEPMPIVPSRANADLSAQASVRAIARDALAGAEADPHAIARHCLPKLTGEQREAILLKGLSEIVMEEIRHARSPARVGESRWQRAIRDRRPTSDGWKLYENCTVADLDELITGYDRIIDGAARERDELRAMRERLAASKCQTVGELLAREKRRAAA